MGCLAVSALRIGLGMFQCTRKCLEVLGCWDVTIRFGFDPVVILCAVIVVVDEGGEARHGALWIPDKVCGTQLAKAFEKKCRWIYYMNLFIIYIYRWFV
jgi:hypothetical protein